MDAFLLSQSGYCQLSGVPTRGKTRRHSPDRIRIAPQGATSPVPTTCAACQKVENAFTQTLHPAKQLRVKKKLSHWVNQPCSIAAMAAAKAGSESSADKECLATQNVTRRQGLARVAALTLLSALADVSKCSKARADTPYSQTQGKQTVVGLLKGRLRACPSDYNPNCVSSASNNASYMSPWELPERLQGQSSKAAQAIETAVLATQKNATILKSEPIDDKHYVLAEVDGRFGRDLIEFLVKRDVVTYRSIAEKVIFVYPFTTPISDLDAQRKRMEQLRQEIGWRLVGCELIECYQ
ncbi:hypothetical protein KFL_000270480 [Klebsormidium nitens]|uniref:Thylakoid lumenal 17.9 kDa protein n=1 Tax=Klebsormidium nitens TaxID=105231 RepID=A0A1Y1HTX3_KLENI|nr:hypothetical protein KFL_000270480 [Klebsormidium nitens]|eukprot:GAQ79288.1 hypothetical protein KFL_000270480 [Klebsormidium nitens]